MTAWGPRAKPFLSLDLGFLIYIAGSVLFHTFQTPLIGYFIKMALHRSSIQAGTLVEVKQGGSWRWKPSSLAAFSAWPDGWWLSRRSRPHEHLFIAGFEIIHSFIHSSSTNIYWTPSRCQAGFGVEDKNTNKVWPVLLSGWASTYESGHLPRLRSCSLEGGVQEAVDQWFSLAIDVSIPLTYSPFLSKINKKNFF